MAGFGDRRREAELQAWVEEGIITAAQAGRIREARRRSPDSPGAFAMLAAIGGLCIALGIVLVIAYNWDRFHRAWKLGGFLVSLVVVVETAGRLPERMRLARAAAVTGWLLLPLAGIGLMAQVYQLSGDPLKPILLWLALGVPAAVFALDPLVSFVHTAGLAVAAWVGAYNHGTGLSLLRDWDEAGPYAPGRWVIPASGLAALWLAAGWQASRRLGPRSRRWLLAALLVFLWSLATGSTVLGVHSMRVQFLVVGALISIFQGARGLLGLDDETTDGWAAVLTFAALFAATFLWHSDGGGLGGETPSAGLGYAGVLAITGLATVLLNRPEHPGQSAYASLPGRLLILAPLAIGAALTAGAGMQAVAVAANLASLGFSVREMSEGVSRARPNRVTLGILMLGAVIVTRFLDYFGTMLQSGVAFIAAGVAFIGLAWVLTRGRSALLARMADRR